MPNPYSLGQIGVEPPSYMPQIASLSSMMDSFVARAFQMREAERRQAQLDLQNRKQDEYQQYGMRKQDLLEQKQDEQARKNAEQERFARTRQNFAAGQAWRKNPAGGTIEFLDPETGKPMYSDPRLVQDTGPQPPAPPPQAPPAPDVGGIPSGVGQPPSPVPQIPSMMAPPPQAPMAPPAGVGQPGPSAYGHDLTKEVFVDRFDDAAEGGQEATVLVGPDSQPIKVPAENLPPGTREGAWLRLDQIQGQQPQGPSFDDQLGEQLSQVPEQPAQEPEGGWAPEPDIPATTPTPPQASVTRSPQTVVRGSRWELDVPGGNKITVDPNLARQEAMEKAQYQITNLDRAIAKAKADGNQILERALSERQALLIGDLPDLMQMQKLSTQERLAGQQIQSREKVAAERNATTLKVAEMRRKKGGGVFGGGKIKTGGGEYIPIPQTKYGSRPDMLVDRVERSWASYARDERFWEQFKGWRRVAMAAHNIAYESKNAGVTNIEAAFNFLGFVRGGVPVENETKEMLEKRRTWADRIHGFLARAGLGELAAKLEKGGELTRQETEEAMNVMSPAEKARIREGIQESTGVMRQQLMDGIGGFTSLYSTFDGPGGHLMRQHATSIVNSRLRSLGFPADFNPYTDTTLPKRGKYAADEGQPSAGGEGSGGAPKLSDEDLLKQLKEIP